ncbi:MAG: dihydroorotate dehydrogenase-like protein [Planctomycetaceae bacterium]|nr:dihydroorotate dehydrogenase-like protein [Planctomycetaceae bacterium]
MDLTTNYLGLRLPHPLVAGASPLVDDLELVQRVADAGASAIVMHSLFEEQIRGEALARERFHDVHALSHAEAPSYLPASDEFRLGPDEYLEQIRRIRRRVPIPVIASLNGTTEGSWLAYARSTQEAGANALELNLYELVTSIDVSADDVERRSLDVVRAVRKSVTIPVAVKLSPFYTSLPRFASQLVASGADGIVLFNRFYQADIDADALEVVRSLRLSEPGELLLRLRWLAILSAQVRTSYAVSGGVHSGLDAVKAVMAGADCVQVVSALLRHGPERMGTLLSELREWLEQHEYDSLEQARGSMNLKRCPDPRGFERANYVQVLQSWRFE